MYIDRPGSPSATMLSPRSKRRSSSIEIRRSKLASETPPNKGVATKNAFSSGELTIITSIYSCSRNLSGLMAAALPYRKRVDSYIFKRNKPFHRISLCPKPNLTTSMLKQDPRMSNSIGFASWSQAQVPLVTSNRLAAALGARLSCRRGAQAPQAEARIHQMRTARGSERATKGKGSRTLRPTQSPSSFRSRSRSAT